MKNIKNIIDGVDKCEISHYIIRGSFIVLAGGLIYGFGWHDGQVEMNKRINETAEEIIREIRIN